MTAQELNWSLETIPDAANTQRFVVAQCERGKISLQLLADVARKRVGVKRTAKQFAIAMTRYSNPYTARRFPTAIG